MDREDVEALNSALNKVPKTVEKIAERLAARYGRLAVVWVDAHGDLNTPETSPSGNEWGMPLRMAIDRR